MSPWGWMSLFWSPLFLSFVKVNSAEQQFSTYLLNEWKESIYTNKQSRMAPRLRDLCLCQTALTCWGVSLVLIDRYRLRFIIKLQGPNHLAQRPFSSLLICFAAGQRQGHQCWHNPKTTSMVSMEHSLHFVQGLTCSRPRGPGQMRAAGWFQLKSCIYVIHSYIDTLDIPFRRCKWQTNWSQTQYPATISKMEREAGRRLTGLFTSSKEK